MINVKHINLKWENVAYSTNLGFMFFETSSFLLSGIFLVKILSTSIHLSTTAITCNRMYIAVESASIYNMCSSVHKNNCFSRNDKKG